LNDRRITQVECRSAHRIPKSPRVASCLRVSDDPMFKGSDAFACWRNELAVACLDASPETIYLALEGRQITRSDVGASR
jgi:hypothetical protein